MLPLIIGLLMLRGVRPQAPRISGSAAVVLLLGLGTAAAGAWSLKPPPDQPFTTVVFAPGTTMDQVWTPLSATDARLIWTDPTMGVVVVDAPADQRWSFYRHRALLVSGSGVPAGCFNWSRV